MNQDDFRRLLATGGGDSGSNNHKRKKHGGGARKLKEIDLEGVRRLSAKRPKNKSDKGKSTTANHDGRTMAATTLTTTAAAAPQYRDRAAERRQGQHGGSADAESLTHVDLEQSTVLGGAKGLDFALLAQLKREKENLERAAAAERAKAAHEGTQGDGGAAKGTQEELTFRSRMARMVYYHACERDQQRAHKSELFLPGRMYYTFNLTSLAYESAPKVVQRSKEDCPEVDEMLSGHVDELVITHVREALENRRAAKKIRRKHPTPSASRSDEGAAALHTDHADGARAEAVADEAVDARAVEEDDEDIFPDAGEYVPSYLRAEESNVNTATGAASGYFSNLSASLTASEEARQRQEAKAENAWKETLKKAIVAQSQVEKEREAKARAAKLAAEQDSYTECFPEYQAAAGYDSEDDDGGEKAKKRKDAESAEPPAAEELARRKKQKQTNKLTSDLEKIQKLHGAGA